MNTIRITFLSSLLGSVSLISLIASVEPSLANPLGGTVEAGTATIDQLDPNTLVVLQETQRAIVNWDSFNVDRGETTRFVLPNAQSVTLNRDLSGSLSEIYGTIESNGQFFLVNPNGILFGPNSRVDVAGLVATTHDIRSQDFMVGNYEFGIPGNPIASVINQGQVSVQELGFGAFVAPHVRNEGSVVARMGRIELASANGFTLDMHGDRLISFLVENPNQHQIYDSNGELVTALVENNGELIADGGIVAMSASAARGVVNSVINTDGIVQANTVEQRGGKIILGGGTSGTVRTAGRVTARGESSGDTGGHIQVTGEVVSVAANATVDASGAAGGGTVLIGGDYLGGNTTNAAIFHLGIELEPEEIQTARATIVESGARIAADALDFGDGGKLIVWGDEVALSYGHLSARGGAAGGDGGFIETSGAFLDVGGIADASASNGAAGTWLLDPLDIAIDTLTNGAVDIDFGVEIPLFVGGTLTGTTFTPTARPSVISASLLEASLNSGTNTIVTTFNTSGTGSGDIFLRTNINKTAGGDAILGLYAVGDIRISSGVNINSFSGRMTLDLFGQSIEAGNMGELNLGGGFLSMLPSSGATLSTSSPMPYYVVINHRTALLGSGEGRVNLSFGRDSADYRYTTNDVTFQTGSIDLRDSRSDGRLDLYFDRPVDATLHNRSIRLDANHNLVVWNRRNQGVAPSDALDGIPEVISASELQNAFYEESRIGNVPVVEVSRSSTSRVDGFRVTAPSGQAILAAYLADIGVIDGGGSDAGEGNGGGDSCNGGRGSEDCNGRLPIDPPTTGPVSIITVPPSTSTPSTINLDFISRIPDAEQTILPNNVISVAQTTTTSVQGPTRWSIAASGPIFNQQNASDTRLYINATWASNVGPDGRFRWQDTCLAAVYAMIEQSRPDGNREYRIGAPTNGTTYGNTWDDSVGATGEGLTARIGSERNFEIGAVRSELNSGNSVILRGTATGQPDHFMLAVGLTASGNIIANDPWSGTQITIDPITLVATLPNGSRSPLSYTISRYRTVN